MQVNLSEIIIDESIYPRSGGVSPVNVERMIAAAKTGIKFPPIILDSATMRLVDGRHRYIVAKELDTEKIAATLKTYNSEADLFADAVRLNIGHGLQLDSYSVQNAIIRLTKYGLTKDAIAEAVRLPVEKIEKIERGFATAADTGEPVAVKGGLRHLARQVLTPEQVTTNQNYGGLKATFYARQISELLKHDMQPRTSAFVAAMDELVTLWTKISHEQEAA